MNGRWCRHILLVLPVILLWGCTNGVLTGTLADDVSGVAQSRGSFNGTFRGGIYSHTVEPITFNRHPTDILELGREAKGRINQFQYPFSVVSVRLGKNGLGDVAKEHGIKRIYFADLEKWTVLFGIWSTDIVHIYGR